MTDKKKPAYDAHVLRNAAVKALIENHQVEFDALLDAEYAKVGAKRVVRKTAEQRAYEAAMASAAKRAAKEAARREKALAAARALAAEFPEFVAVNEPVEEDEVDESGLDEFLSPTG